MALNQFQYLLDLIQGTHGVEWAKKVGWGMDTNACNYKGVECNNHGDVSSIYLEGTGLVATLPESLSYLSSLRKLYLGSNQIYGTIPIKIAEMSTLVDIDLSNNAIRGNIPTFSSTHVQTINLSNNLLTGQIPENFGDNKHHLSILNIENNQINGTIPSIFNNMENLSELNMKNNVLSGSIPQDFHKLIDLKSLHLEYNKLTGKIPQNSFHPGMIKLSDIFIHGNDFSGEIPMSFGELTSLSTLILVDNKFTGEVPNEICEMELNRDILDIFEESEFERRQKARILSDSETLDRCDSISCPVGYESVNGNGAVPCSPCKSEILAPYIGVTKCQLFNESLILNELYTKTNGDNWNINSTWTGQTPICTRYGVSCNSKGKVESIMLPGTNLSGTIPSSLGFLPYLKKLDLSDNNLVGKLPSDLQFSPLQSIDVSGNNIIGLVPQGLCLKNGLNGNGENNLWSCDKVACAAGSYSSTGRAAENSSSCTPCKTPKGLQYLGMKTCIKGNKSNDLNTGMVILLVILPISFLALLLWFLEKKKLTDNEPYGNNSPSRRAVEESARANYISNGGSYMNSNMPAPSKEEERGTFASTSQVWLDVPRIH